MVKLPTPFRFNVRLLLPEVIVSAVALFILLQNINAPLWNDEMYSLDKFSLTSFSRTVTYYPVPNNHVFYNLMNNLYFTLTGTESLYELMDSPRIARLPGLLYSVTALIFIYLIGREFFNRAVGSAAVALTVTTIPFYHFALEVRGYGLSTLLLVLTVYFTAKYLKHNDRRQLTGMFISSLLLLYTIPSNAYALATLPFFFALYAAVCSIDKIHARIFNRKYRSEYSVKSSVTVIAVITAAACGSLLLYSVIFEEVFMNEYVYNGTFFNLDNLKNYSSELFSAGLSGRWWLLPFTALGIIAFLAGNNRHKPLLLLFVLFTFFPVLPVYVRGDFPPSRIFTVVTPFYGLIGGLGITRGISILVKNKVLNTGILSASLLYALFAFYGERIKIREKLKEDLSKGAITQNIYYRFYDYNFSPQKTTDTIAEHFDKNPLPIILQGCMPYGICNYFEKDGIPYSVFDHFVTPRLRSTDSIYFVTNDPLNCSTVPEYDFIPLYDNLSYYSPVLVAGKREVYDHIRDRIREFSRSGGDSAGVVLCTRGIVSTPDLIEDERVFTLTEDGDYPFGALSEFAARHEPVLYIRTFDFLPGQTFSILSHRFNAAIPSDIPGVHFYYFGNKAPLHYDQILTPIKADTLTRNERRFDQSLTSELEYSKLFQIDASSMKELISVHFNSRFKCGEGGVIVMDIYRGEELVDWQKADMDPYCNDASSRYRISATFTSNAELQPDDRVSLYIWNNQRSSIDIKSFTVVTRDREPGNWKRKAEAEENIP